MLAARDGDRDSGRRWQRVWGSNIRTTIALADDSTLEHVLLQDVPSVQVHLSRVDVTQRAGSVFKARSFNLGAAYGRIAYNVQTRRYRGPRRPVGAVLWLCDQTLDQQVNVVHAGRRLHESSDLSRCTR